MEDKSQLFDLLNYHTSYQYELRYTKEGKPEILSSQGIITGLCFSNLFNNLSNYNKNQKIYIDLCIYLNTDIEKVQKFLIDNLVIVDKDTVIRHIEMAKRLFDFEYSFEYPPDDNDHCDYGVRIHMTGNTLQIKFICSWIRYLYEFPANVLMSDIYKLIDAGHFNRVSVFNLIMLLNETLYPETSISDEQCIKLDGVFQSDERLRDKLSEGGPFLSNLYFSRRRRLPNSCRLNIKETNYYSVYSYNYWTSSDRLAERFLVYEKALKEYTKGWSVGNY